MFDSRRELLDVHRETPVILRLMLRGVDDDAARRPPPEGGWSIVEVVAHLADSEERARERVGRMLAEDVPSMTGYDQETLAEEHSYRGMQLAGALQRFEEQRAAQIRTLERLDESGWERRARHNQLGDLTIEVLVSVMATHDAVHLAQIARIVAAERGTA